jgi:2-polyprenyl-6-hydroxyphenyl methylase / 3-demethylubiquinone-9 3-methyltransferase
MRAMEIPVALRIEVAVNQRRSVREGGGGWQGRTAGRLCGKRGNDRYALPLCHVLGLYFVYFAHFEERYMTAATHPTINPSEAAHFGAMAEDWWDPKGSSAMLHKLNPVRLGYVRGAVNDHFGVAAQDLKPLSGRTVLDVGCGAGLMCEPLARLGGIVTGIDAAPENVAVARAHAAGQGLMIDYRAGDVATLCERFDVVTSMEVIEHVVDPEAFVAALAARLAPGGLMILSTPNRTALSRLGLITLGEGLGRIPRGTHDWNKFLTPDELTTLVEAVGLTVRDVCGLSFDVGHGFTLSRDVKLNYLMTATWR